MAAFTVQMNLAAPAARKVQLRAPAAASLSAPRRAAVRVAAFRTNTVAAAAADTLDKVRGIISEQLGMDVEKVTAASKFVDLGADSLDTVEIMMALEEQFEITLDEEGAEKITTVQEAADLIQSQMK